MREFVNQQAQVTTINDEFSRVITNEIRENIFNKKMHRETQSSKITQKPYYSKTNALAQIIAILSPLIVLKATCNSRATQYQHK